MRRPLILSAAFVRAAQRLMKKQPRVSDAIRQTLTRLESDASDPRLGTHKLKGDLDGAWSCSAGYDLRIVFEFVERDGAECIQLQSIGTHDQVY